MVGSEESGGLDFHTGIVRANKRQVNVPVYERLWKSARMTPGWRIGWKMSPSRGARDHGDASEVSLPRNLLARIGV
jgi:hypothetical protein